MLFRSYLATKITDDEEIGFIIPRTVTAKTEGILYAEIKVKIDADSDYVSSKKVSGENNFEICEVLKSANSKALQ